MAELVTTREEEDAATYLEWDDAALGKLVKLAMLSISTADAQNSITEIDAIGAAAGVGIVIWKLHGLGMTGMKMAVKDLTCHGESLGSWAFDVVKKE
ncbi:MAG: hypothetical protein EON58_02245 [Alphaproteobacteria bacterium]|nr:MAG: hypothetical protein EON58_02245 [Alphaproteobacteria bacterium]